MQPTVVCGRPRSNCMSSSDPRAHSPTPLSVPPSSSPPPLFLNAASTTPTHFTSDEANCDSLASLRYRSHSGSDSASDAVSPSTGRWTASRPPTERSPHGPSAVLHSRSAHDLHCFRSLSAPAPTPDGAELPPAEQDVIAVDKLLTTLETPILNVGECLPRIPSSTPPLGISFTTAADCSGEKHNSTSPSPQLDDDLVPPPVPSWTLVSPTTKRIRAMSRACGRPLRHNVTLDQFHMRKESSLGSESHPPPFTLPEGSERLLASVTSGPIVGGAIAHEGLFTTFNMFKDYHTQWSQDDSSRVQALSPVSTKKNTEILNSTGNEVVAWYQQWLKTVRNATEEDFDLDTFVYHFRDVSNLKAHPLGPVLKRSLNQVCSEIAIVPDIGTDNAVEEILRITEEHAMNMGNDVTKVYKSLTRIQSVVDRALLEIIFQHARTILWDCYVSQFSGDDDNYRQHSAQYSSISPSQMGVRKEFWLNERNGTVQPPDFVPYGTAIEAAKRLGQAKTPWEKTQCLIDVAHGIKTCVDNFWGKGRTVSITADDFLPLFAFVLLKANLQHPFTDCKYIEHFMSDDDLRGEAGYIFVTFQTALTMITSLRPEEIVVAMHNP
ncbi:hypothetical protein Pelo_13858 [Pelomyxa schiedti]|nr:hypothetical protein Pelo_13858 [Pelomyxa schiedti]